MLAIPDFDYMYFLFIFYFVVTYRECMHILETRRWTNELRKKHFESGVRMGVGTFNLVKKMLLYYSALI